jgi:hypothetical protein
MSTDPSPLSQNGPQGYPQASSDEIDLIDLLRTLWDLKFYAVGGLVAGVAIALAVVPFAVKTKYVAKLNVNLDLQSFPAISASEEVVKKLNEQLGTDRADRILSASVIQEFPEFAKSPQDGAPLFSGRTAVTAKDLPVVVESALGNNRFMIGLTLPARPTSKGNIRRAVTRGINEIVGLANQQADQIYLAQSRVALQNARIANEKTQELVQKNRNDERSLAPISAEIQIAEFRLQSMSLGLNARAKEFLRYSVAPKTRVAEGTEDKRSREMTADAIMYRQSNEQLTRSFAILAMLASETRN